MTEATHDGGCLCGAVRYRIAGNPGSAGYCHCDDCRRVTGSAFNVSIGIPEQTFTLLRGELGDFTKTADSGRPLTRHFCTRCGSPIYTSSPSHAGTIYVKAGSLDDAEQVVPDREAWTRSRVAWSVVPKTVRSFAKGSH